MTQKEIEDRILGQVADGAEVPRALAGAMWGYATRKGDEEKGEEPGFMREVFDIARIRFRQKSYELYGRMKDSIRSSRMRRPLTPRFGV